MASVRRDAVRSREALLDALQEMYTELGTLPGTHALAARAGVGVATLYRHFPTREDLLVGLGTARLGDLVDLVEEAAEVPDAGEAVGGFFRGVVRSGCDPALTAHVTAEHAGEEARELLRRFEGGVSDLLTRAHAAGVLRTDVTRARLIAHLHGLLATVSNLGGAPDDADFACDALLRGLAP
jgi:AcrR family transcriptional regulator